MNKKHSKISKNSCSIKIFQKNSKKFAFTLAETMIAFMIIGIVASITVVVLVQNNQKDAFALSLKKFYSTTQQALNYWKTENVCGDAECMGFVGSVQDPEWNNMMENHIKKYFNIRKICKYGDSSCEGHTTCGFNSKNCGTSFGSEQFSYITADGMYVRILPTTTSGAWYNWTLDVNGPAGPNIIGRDVHLFRMYKDGTLHAYCDLFYAQGGNPKNNINNNLYWKTNTKLCDPKEQSYNGNSYGCTARIMENNWKIDF